MKWHRIWGVTLRYLYYFRHSIDRMSDAFYWPTVDLVLFGLTSRFFVSAGNVNPNLILSIIGGVLLWIIIWRGQYEITINFLEELWSHNLVNLFVAPLHFVEWVASLMLIGIAKAILSFSFATGIAYLLYRTNIWAIGWYLLPYALILIMFGWAVGLFITGILIRYGTKVQTLGWTAIMVAAPFSAVYYPVSILPAWAQNIAAWVPTSYIFEAVRASILEQTYVLDAYPRALFLCVLYLTLSFTFLSISYRVALKRGLIGLE